MCRRPFPRLRDCSADFAVGERGKNSDANAYFKRQQSRDREGAVFKRAALKLCGKILYVRR